MELSSDEKKLLLKTARESIRKEFEDVKIPELDYSVYPKLKMELGAFVTIKIKNDLKGCIGYIIGQKPLYETIIEAAKQAAFGDPRFIPLSKEEFDKIDIEISVLSLFEPIKSYDEIEVGKHGLLLDEGGRAVLLPQVATEQNYNRSEFLTALCHKAGLYGDYWKERLLKIKVFTAHVFGEEEN
ncbi:MAG: AmmeMemoRadiSam system protein A [Ignavibacteria bacterium]|nr:AmmeMemoRadiSam system protein A [Ignavibacteria bacterium]MBT8382403.1 AmmeMemoRadiSam system protein A [Ignavibacteria bacterium]MBT8393069.1 AmmeMemoRadiSam system protein A [Ignavibacteria bacterium]NNJ53588.1 AmmeMemoRadiSam system protein A [Ignavibacteriaceae bacterium]NNL20195.1 AmmeMemoRadiSam system protein A [Ignavibacteriaceae bacterium]